MGLFSRDKNKTDEQLMEAVQDGSAKAFEILYDRYSSALLNYFYKMLWQKREKAEDFMQDLFTKIAEKPNSFDTSRTFKTWLYSIANNMCKNEYRKQEVRKGTSNGLHENMATDNAHISIEKQIDGETFNTAMMAELAKLKETHKTAFILRYQKEMSLKEIAQVMECSEGTIKSRLFYTLKKLSENLQVYKPIATE